MTSAPRPTGPFRWCQGFGQPLPVRTAVDPIPQAMTMIDRWMTMRLTYDDVLYGWDEVLEEIRAVTRPDRHRIRRCADTRRTDPS